MKKLLLFLIFTCFTTSGVFAADVKMNLNAIYGQNSFHTQGAMYFADLVEEYTDGSVDITVHPGGSLGFKGPELLKAVKDAQVPMSDILMGVVAGSEHVFGISSLPRLASSFDEAKELYEDTKPLYKEAAAKWNQKFLYAAPWPPSGLVTKNKVETAADIKNAKIRTYDKNGANFLRELGAAGISMPWGEVYSALRTGLIDGVLTSAESAKNGKFWEVLGHFNNINYAFPLNMVTINKDYWDSLSDEQQKAMLKAAAETEKHQWESSEAKTKEALNVIEENGIVISQPSEKFAEQMDAAAKVIVNNYLEDASSETEKVLEKYIK
ncbi:Extracellular solute-binding protein, family 7 [Flexistipes sinusarabici DSM 4947]|uniref:Extracellular solute-binding protein, family 7 n=1 Tax=Flexistipes sinusarabici (strain ATCC 49648 / DSM 4947 / MAS 10) TaxID=717231 RepID=F8E840_FLESM|nr:TRAP transporter substrate-binding protein [Flexistipes sinusarabici]AEI13964.1 Extracellular solute-binding protein, family 7 [Flexistipes sinusarabici DSM 4947]